jgi:hypothetical protein
MNKRNLSQKALLILAVLAYGHSHAGFVGSLFGDEAGARKAVLAELNDPDSAKFGEFDRYDENNVCIKVNAKNHLGGYTGWQTAFVRKTDGQWEVIGISDVLDPCAIAKSRNQ